MKTSCFFSIPRGTPGGISIARYQPRGMAYPTYRALAPHANMLKMPFDEYLPLYLAILERLDPTKVVEELAFLVEPDEPVLLCWERPPLTATNWCHRSICAAWFQEHLGMDVPEVRP